MAWRRPPRLAPRQLKRTGQRAEDGGGPGPSGTSVRSSISGSTVKTTVKKKASVPGEGSKSVTVQLEQSQEPFQPRYNKDRLMHPEDRYRKSKRPPPLKPDQPCPKVVRGKSYSREEVKLWEDWRKYRDHLEEIRCWKTGQPFKTQAQREDEQFAKWHQKEEALAEERWKAGKLKYKPPHMRTPPVVKRPRKRASPLPVQSRSPDRRELSPTMEGKHRYEMRDEYGTFIRYNSLHDPHPADMYKASGSTPPEYVKPPLDEDGKFKKGSEMTQAEKDDLRKYRVWEEYYFQVQAWEKDEKYVGDPFIHELMKDVGPLQLKAPAKKGVAGPSRARGRSPRPPSRSGPSRTPTRGGSSSAIRQLLAEGMPTPPPRSAFRGTSPPPPGGRMPLRREASTPASTRTLRPSSRLLPAPTVAAKPFLRRGARSLYVPKRGKLDLSKVKSRIVLREPPPAPGCRLQQQVAAAAPPPEEVPPPIFGSPGFVPPTPPSLETFEEYEREKNYQKYVRAFNRDRERQRRHQELTGNPQRVRFYNREYAPTYRGEVSYLYYQQDYPPKCLFWSSPSGIIPPDPPGYEPREPQEGRSPDDPEVPPTRFGLTPMHPTHPSPPMFQTRPSPFYPIRPEDRLAYDMELLGDIPVLEDGQVPPGEEEYFARVDENWLNEPLQNIRREQQARIAAHPLSLRFPTVQQQFPFEEPEFELNMPEVYRPRGFDHVRSPPFRTPSPVVVQPRAPSPRPFVEPPCAELIDMRTPPPRVATPPPATPPPRSPSPPRVPSPSPRVVDIEQMRQNLQAIRQRIADDRARAQPNPVEVQRRAQQSALVQRARLLLADPEELDEYERVQQQVEEFRRRLPEGFRWQLPPQRLPDLVYPPLGEQACHLLNEMSPNRPPSPQA